MEKQTWSMIKRFIRTAGAGIFAFLLMGLAGMQQTPEVLLVTAVLVALDKYFRAIGLYGNTQYN